MHGSGLEEGLRKGQGDSSAAFDRPNAWNVPISRPLGTVVFSGRLNGYAVAWFYVPSFGRPGRRLLETKRLFRAVPS